MTGKIKIGVNPTLWINRHFPKEEGEVTVEHLLSEAALIGYQGYELEPPLLKRGNSLARIASSRGLTCAAGWHDLRLLESNLEQELDRLHAHLDNLERFGASVVNLCEVTGCAYRNAASPTAKRPILETDQWGTLCERLDDIAAVAADRGFQSAYHQHLGTVVESWEDLERLMDGTRRLGLTLDASHFACADIDSHQVMQVFSERVTHVHLTNIRQSVLEECKQSGCDLDEAILKGLFTVPGDDAGVQIAFRPLIEDLVRNGYCGWIIVGGELNLYANDSYTYAQLGYQQVKTWLCQTESTGDRWTSSTFHA